MPAKDLPEVRRVGFHDLAFAAAGEVVPDDPDRAGRVASAATHSPILHRLQTALDQLVRHAEGRRRGEDGPYGHNFAGYVKAELEGAARIVDEALVVATAAQSMFRDVSGQLQALEAAMAKARDDKDPQLTASGEPHPLQAGGYDPAADPALPSNISDVEALKEGKTTRAQSEAIAAADAEKAGDAEPTPSDEADVKAAADAGIATPVTTPKATRAAADDDDDKGKRGKSRK